MAKNILVLINAAAYGSERAFSALRISATLSAHEEKPNVHLFLMSDAVGIALSGQNAAGATTHETMLKEIISNGAEVLMCQTCINSRGLQDAKWIEGVKVGTLNDLAAWTLKADSTLSF